MLLLIIIYMYMGGIIHCLNWPRKAAANYAIFSTINWSHPLLCSENTLPDRGGNKNNLVIGEPYAYVG